MMFLKALVLFLASFALCCYAQKPSNQKQRWTMVNWENDIFAFSDDGYTNGVGFAWGYSGHPTLATLGAPQWLNNYALALGLKNDHQRRFSAGYRIAQGMYTPDNIESKDLVTDDRPYAGTLTWRGNIKSHNATSASGRGLVLGFIGPIAKAGETQKWIHDITNGTEPMGWHNQISNEPIFRVDGERIDQIYSTHAFGQTDLDVTMYYNAGLGNYRSDVGIGATLRLGNVLNESFAFVNPNPARGVNTLARLPDQGFYWQWLVGVYTTYVFNDITLQGNTFKESHGVTLIHPQAMASTGVVASYNNWGLIFSLQKGTDTFEEQKTDTEFGSVSLTYWR